MGNFQLCDTRPIPIVGEFNVETSLNALLNAMRLVTKRATL